MKKIKYKHNTKEASPIICTKDDNHIWFPTSTNLIQQMQLHFEVATSLQHIVESDFLLIKTQ